MKKILASDPLYLGPKNVAANLAAHLAPLKGTGPTVLQLSMDRCKMLQAI